MKHTRVACLDITHLLSWSQSTIPALKPPFGRTFTGGGFGWFDKNQTYQTVKTLTQDTWNHEESFDGLIEAHLLHNTHSRNGELMSSTLTRRIQEGYRVLLVALCDHDNYAGRGSPYANNPNPSAQVNGLQATMAAMDYTVANYSTSQVFAHGTSCGSLGAWAVAAAYRDEDIYLTAIVADSWTFDPPRIFELFDIYVGVDPYPFNGGDLRGDGMEKLGFDYLGLGQYPEAMIRDGFTEVPSMFIIGELDPACGGKLPTIPAADEANLSNCRWHYDRLRQAIDEQPNTPHILDFAPDGDHVDTNRNSPVNKRVDNFLAEVWSTDPPRVFGPQDPKPTPTPTKPTPTPTKPTPTTPTPCVDDDATLVQLAASVDLFAGKTITGCSDPKVAKANACEYAKVVGICCAACTNQISGSSTSTKRAAVVVDADSTTASNTPDFNTDIGGNGGGGGGGGGAGETKTETETETETEGEPDADVAAAEQAVATAAAAKSEADAALQAAQIVLEQLLDRSMDADTVAAAEAAVEAAASVVAEADSALLAATQNLASVTTLNQSGTTFAIANVVGAAVGVIVAVIAA